MFHQSQAASGPTGRGNQRPPRISLRRRLAIAGLPPAALIACLILAPLQAMAQAAAPDASVVSQVGKPILPKGQATVADGYHALRTPQAMDAAQAALRAAPTHAEPAPRPTMGDDAYRAAKAAADAMRRTRREKTLLNCSALPGPLISPGFVDINKSGPSESMSGDGFYPPDTTGAISATQVVFPVNQTLNVYSRSTGKLQKSTSFPAFFGTSDSLSDPRVQYDPIWNRWVVTDTRIPQAGDTVSACFWFAVSKTASATGSWWVYRPCMSGGFFAAGDLWDYDMLGISQDGLLVTGNIFGSSGFKGAAVLAIDKAAVYNGLGWSSPVFTLPTTTGTVSPPVVQDSNANAFFLAADSSGTVLDLYRGTNLSNQSQFSFTLQAQIPVTAYSVPPSATQPGTSQVLDTLDGRFQAAVAQYGSTLWGVHTVNLGGFPAPYFYQLNTSGNTVAQSGFFFESGTSDDFNPSISSNSSGDAFVVWSTTDSTSTIGLQHNARVDVSGRQPGDALGTMGTLTVLATSAVALTGNQQGSVQRWGDYSAVSLDPVAATCGANQRAAVFNEKILNANTWGSQYALIGFCN